MFAGGDGSTLSLDFTTMSGLDSRFTFTRASTATFINSSGLVQFANANLMTYSNPRQTGTAWGTVGTVTWGSSTLTDPTGGSNAQSVTFGTAASAMFNTSGTTVVSGITHTFSVWLRSATGTTTVRIGDANVAPVATVTLTTTWQRFSCQYTTSGTNDGGAIYSQTGTPSAEFYVWGAQVQPGAVVGDLIETSGTIDRNVPRFDHDPTTLAPRGLLLEGSATNLLCWSETFATSGGATNWFYNLNTVSSESETNPAGGATSIQFRETGGSGPLGQNVSAPSTALYTFSVWVRGSVYNGVTTTQCRLAMFDGSVYVTISISKLSGPGSVSGTQFGSVTGLSLTEWTRVQITTAATFTAGATFGPRIFSGSTALETDASVLVWGAQLEVGSGASSYIPTGAGTVQRAADVCNMTGTNFSSWFVDGSPYSMLFKYSMNNPSAWAGTNVDRGVGLLSNNFNNPRMFINAAYRVVSGSAAIGRFVRVYDSGTLDMPTAPDPLASANNVALAFAVNTNDSAVYGSNQIIGTDSSNTLLTGYNQFAIGRTGGSTQHINGCISLIKYWPQRLPNATLQGLVA